MKRGVCLLLLGALAAACCLSAASAGRAAEIPLLLTLSPDATHNNQISLTVTYMGFPSTQTSTASGSFGAMLYASFDPGWNASVSGLGFVPKPTAPGDMSFTNMSFFGGLMSTTNLKGDLTTDTPPRPVNPDGSFPTDWHSLILNGGTLSVLGTPTNLADEPLYLDLWGFTGSLWVSAPTILGNQATYNVEMVLPVAFTDVEIPDMAGATISATGGIRAIGTFTQTIPEPGTLALAVVSLPGLIWCVRRWRK
jgi:hypothetical protein